jgi:TetR/AcrR family transcriptional regulator, tetracycline repressor protein
VNRCSAPRSSWFDADGLEALTLRRLGQRLGVSAMAIYNHVPGKHELLDGIAHLVAREIESPPRDWPWHERVRASLMSTRAACLRHPNAIPLIQTSRAVTPALLRPAEDVLEALSGEASVREQRSRPGRP